ncbi:branched-subunit amino acid transport protein [Anaerobacterium chartisolvens]|uniref:Branched-subunit amino acid transport protein n=1 Tax=Anaerobacterium chartisolvens TaxID=1297424 RepID=A0A369AMB5_9FIRM|nr:AzlD domain-containing protein [Anaerobacterium chartisolvens]RCX10529.1 branched-subunit amino acid transport protein [Anaerobacterium chartisolvens]
MSIFLIILGMAIVTYIPRFLPVLIVDRLKFPGWVNRWLKSIPYAALGALIFPGILSVDGKSPLVGLMGGIAAVILSYLRIHIIFVISGSILVVILVKLLTGL